MSLRLLLSAFAVATVLSGCGGEPEPPTLAEIAKRIGCSDLKQQETDMYSRETGKCTKGSEAIDISTFSSNDARDTYFAIATKIGSGKVEKGDKWITVTRFVEDDQDDEATAPTAAAPRSEAEVCAELFSSSGPTLIADANQILTKYLNAQLDPASLDDSKASKTAKLLRGVAAHAPTSLEASLTAIAGVLDEARQLAAEGAGRESVKITTFKPLIDGSEKIFSTCDAYTE